MRRRLKVSLLLVAACTAYLGFEGALLRLEAAAFEGGRFEEAAQLARPVSVLRRTLSSQLRDQLARLDQRGELAPQLPLLEKLVALAPDPELTRRLEAARLAAAPAETLVLDARTSALSAATDASDPLFNATPLPGDAGPGGQLFRLAHRAPDGTWLDIGEGFSGPLGASFDATSDGKTLVVATDSGLERWALETGEETPLTTEGPPQLVAVRPDGGAIAYTVEEAQGDALYVLEGATSRRIFPVGAAPASHWLGCDWAPDGASVLVRWEEPAADGDEPATHLAWLSLDGRTLTDATLAGAPSELAPAWLRSPDGRSVLLMVGDGAWLRRDGEAPMALSGLGGALGFSPDGRLLAGLQGDTFYVADAAHPEKRSEQRLEALGPAFAPDPARFRWAEGRLHAEGVAVDDEGPGTPTAIDVTLALGIRP